MKIINDISKRHEISQNDTSKESLKINDIFKTPSEKAFFFSTRKTEKIVTALYLVTDVMDPELPLTRSLRLESLDLLNACYQLLTTPGKVVPSEIARVILRLEHVMSLVSIGRITHHISDMNAEVLLGELDKVSRAVSVELSELSEQYASYSQGRTDPEHSVQPALPYSILEDASFDEIAKSRKRQNDIKTTLTTSINDILGKTSVVRKQNDNPEIKTTLNQKPRTQSVLQKMVRPTHGGIDSRKQQILNVVTSHKNATMQDIQKFVTDCSDKTLQREIVSLVALGMIRKEGDKRWATYHTA